MLLVRLLVSKDRDVALRCLFFYKFGKGDKLVIAAFQHLDEVVKTLHHLASAMVLDDERHLELRVFLEVKEFPWVEISDEIAVVLQGTINEPVIKAFWQVVQC